VTVVQTELAAYRPDNAFTLILMMEILEHVTDDAGLVARAAALLAPGGRLLISVPAHAAMWKWRDEVKGHLRRYGRPELTALVEGAGLAVERVWSWGWPFINFFRWLDRRKPARSRPRAAATALSAVEADVNPGPSWFSRGVVTAVPFAVMDLFLGTDAGVGYILLARKEGKA
jgi:SAM-dependent methyltransferase